MTSEASVLSRRGIMRSGYGPGRPEIWHAHELREGTRQRKHGYVLIEAPRNVVAGDSVAVAFEYHVGEQEIPVGGQLAIAWRWAYDWGDLQLTDPTQPGFLEIRVERANGPTREVQLQATYDAYGGIEPYVHVLEITVAGQALQCGDRVHIACGNRSHGSQGWRAPTLACPAIRFLMLVDPAGHRQWTEVMEPQPTTCNILAGRAERLVVIAPSDVTTGEESKIIVRAEDRWGNTTQLESRPTLSLYDDDQVAHIGFAKLTGNPPAYHATVILRRRGITRIRARASQLTAISNPVRVSNQRASERVFWGDLHAGQCDMGCGAGSLANHYAYGRDVAGLQFITHQANDHYVTAIDWQHTRDETDAFHEPGKYITLLGCEWSPPTRDGGDRNVIYRHDEPQLRRSGRFFAELEPDPQPDIPTAPEFHQTFRDKEVLVNMHVGGRPTNLKWHEPSFESLAEIHSTHGTSEWFVMDCLQRGYQVAITAGTDGVMGRPGACHPGSRVMRNVRNGLTAILAPELTRDAVWQALKARRCYATSGARILLAVDVDGKPMGAAMTAADSPTITISVEGTAAIEHVDVLRGTEVIHTWHLASAQPSSGLLRLLWSGTAERGTARRQRQIWDGSLSIANGQILLVEPIGFQSPLDEVQIETPERVRWKSSTAGNDAGLLLSIDGDDSVTGRLQTAPCTVDFTLGQIRDACLRVDAGGVGRQVCIGSAPQLDASRHAELQFCDNEQVSGIFPYWVRVVQVDREKAWSSPIYVTRDTVKE